MILDVLLCFLVALGVDPPDAALRCPAWREAVSRFNARHEISGFRASLWWLEPGEEYRPSMLRGVWLESLTMPWVDERERFVFDHNGCYVELAAIEEEAGRLESLRAIYPADADQIDARLALLRYNRRAYSLLSSARGDFITPYEIRDYLATLRGLIGESDFYAGVMPGRWWR